jgi:hypothetical protein
MNLNTQFRKLAIIAVLIGLLATPFVYSSLTCSVTINSSGTISSTNVTALSGSPSDIQAAVNAVVAVGGGTVHIPAGNFTFNPPMNGNGVTIPFTTVPISIIGAGVGITILQETVNGWYSTMFVRSWAGQDYSGSAVRISGISFIGFPEPETTSNGNNAIDIRCTQDFRIDDCSFVNFVGQAIYTDDNTGGTYKLVDRGVIDHCSFDNPYKAALQPHNATGAYYSVWGYGIVICNDYYDWAQNMSSLLGQYYPTTTANSLPQPQPIYIENCNFTRCRHAIASNGAGYYVSRYNYFQESAPYWPNDVHGDSGTPTAPWGGRGLESYSNIFNFTDESYSQGQDAALGIRGGGGVCWNNTVILNPSYNTPTIRLENDGESAPYDVEQFYIWNNTAEWTNGTLVDFNSLISNQAGYTQNVNYFLRAPSQVLDGFTYTPLAYPFTFDSNGIPSISQSQP